MKVVRVNAGKPYEVLVARGFLDQVGRLIRTKVDPCRVCIVSDDIVAPLYGERVRTSLEQAGFTVCEYDIPNGEASKTLDTYAKLLSFLAANRMSRKDIIVALGGGVVGDIAGFAAASYMRGIRFVQIPTTLLAAVDSSVGGKTAVDLPEGKNLVGAFLQPTLVLCDADTLATLPEAQLKCGIAESIKYGILNDRLLFDEIAGGEYDLEDVIAKCVEYKAAYVEQDERDTGVRQMLNLGHTVGHAIEQCADFSVLHGQAVAIGTVVLTRAAQKLGLAEAGTLETILEAYQKLGLPTECGFSAAQLIDAAMNDKKRVGGEITLVVPRSVGNCVLHKLKAEMLEGFIQIGLS